MKPEQIGQCYKYFKRGGYETWLKRKTNKARRRAIKYWINNQHKPEPNDKQYCGWSW